MIRLAICQRRLRHYRVPAYDLLGRQADIELTLFAAPDDSAREALGRGDRGFRFDELSESDARRLPGGFVRHPVQVEVVDRSRFDLVILPWDLHYLPTLRPALRRGRREGVKVALWGHGFSKRADAVRDALRNALGRRADAVLLYSHGVARRLVERRRFDRERVFVAQNAINQGPVRAARQHWRENGEALRAFQSEHGLDPRRTAIFVSRLLPENRGSMLIDALAIVRRRVPDARLVIVGEGPDRPALETRTAAAGAGDHVIFAGAIYDDRALAPWMLSSAVFCYPVNVGLSMLHAFGYGLPAITSDRLSAHGPEIEALEPQRNGLLYRDGAVEGLADAWASLLTDETLREAMSRAALEQVEQRYTLPNMIQGFLDLVSIVDGESRTVKP